MCLFFSWDFGFENQGSLAMRCCCGVLLIRMQSMGLFGRSVLLYLGTRHHIQNTTGSIQRTCNPTGDLQCNVSSLSLSLYFSPFSLLVLSLALPPSISHPPSLSLSLSPSLSISLSHSFYEFSISPSPATILSLSL